MAKEKPKSEAVQEDNKLEAIKQIIFGQEKRDFDRQIGELKEAMESRFEATLAQLEKRHQEAVKQLEEKDKVIQAELKRLDTAIADLAESSEASTNDKLGNLRKDLSLLLSAFSQGIAK